MGLYYLPSPAIIQQFFWPIMTLIICVQTYKKFGLVAKIGVGTFVCLIYIQNVKGSEAQKQRPHKLLWKLWFDVKSISNIYILPRYMFFMSKHIITNYTRFLFKLFTSWCGYERLQIFPQLSHFGHLNHRMSQSLVCWTQSRVRFENKSHSFGWI